MAENGGTSLDLMDAAPAPGLLKLPVAAPSGKKRPSITIPQPLPMSPTKAATAALAGQKKPVAYSQLARALAELAASGDQKSSQKQLLANVFPKLAIFSTVDPGLTPSLIKLLQVADDKVVLRYTYYYMGRILAESGASAGGIAAPTPGGLAPTNWDVLSSIGDGSTLDRATAVQQIMKKLLADASVPEVAAHPRRVAAFSALSCVPQQSISLVVPVLDLILGTLDKVSEGKIRKHKKGLFGRQSVEKEVLLKTSLQYAALAALARLPLDPSNQRLIARVAQGIFCADPTGVRHALSVLARFAQLAPATTASTVAQAASQGGLLSLADLLSLASSETFARVYLARLCAAVVLAPDLDARPDLRAQFAAVLFALVLDTVDKVAMEAVACVVGSLGGEGSPEQRATAWRYFERARMVIDIPDEKPPGRRSSSTVSAAGPLVQPVLKVVAQRLELSLRSASRPLLHAACRVVGELGMARAAATALDDLAAAQQGAVSAEDGPSLLSGPPAGVVSGGGVPNLLADLAAPSGPPSASKRGPVEATKGGLSDQALQQGKRPSQEELAACLAPLAEAVRTTVACECHFVRSQALKAMIWLQAVEEPVDELQSTIAGELADPTWPTSLLNDLLLTIHARFKATSSMAGILLRLTNLWITLVPAKVDVDVLQLLWKTCLVGCGPQGKHTALEAVGTVLDLSAPKPAEAGSQAGMVVGSDAKSATARHRLMQAAVWFLGENANYAASEYAWEPPKAGGAMLMMMEGASMVVAAGVRNPTMGAALARLQRCAVAGNWELRVVAAQALMTVALRSGEPFRLQCYEFFHSVLHGERLRHRLQEQKMAAVSGAASGEDEGGSGSGLANVVAPMLRMLDELYAAQEEMMKDIRQHDNSKRDWSDDELRRLYETHERLLDLVNLFCFVPKTKYLPLGPTSAALIEEYRLRHHITTAPATPQDPAAAAGIADLLDFTGGGAGLADLMIPTPSSAGVAGGGAAGAVNGPWASTPPGMDLVNDFLGGGTPAANPTPAETPALLNLEDMWASSLLGDDDGAPGVGAGDRDETHSSGSSSPESIFSSQSDVSSSFVSRGSMRRDSGKFNPTFAPLEDDGEEATSQSRPPTDNGRTPGGAGPSGASNAAFEADFNSISDTPPPNASASHVLTPSASAKAPAVSSYMTPTTASQKSPPLANDWFDSQPTTAAKAFASEQQVSDRRELDLETFTERADRWADGRAEDGTTERKRGRALYDFAAAGQDELSLTAGDELEVVDEVDGWYHVVKLSDRSAGLVPVSYVTQ